jgi:channel protein (hemolysin III family)
MLASATLSVPGFAEPVASWSHLLAAGGALFFGVLLVRAHRWRRLDASSLAVFVFGAVFLFSMSGVYHSLDPGGAGRAVLVRLDHAAIWTLIAASYTPIHVLAFRHWFWRWAMLGFIWALAITGLVLKTVFFVEMPEWTGLMFYLLLGWLGMATGLKLYRQGGWEAIRLLVHGGLAYTAGALCDGIGYPILIPGVVGPHELFHFAVVAGVALHWQLIADLARRSARALPAPTPARSSGPAPAHAAPPARVAAAT